MKKLMVAGAACAALWTGTAAAETVDYWDPSAAKLKEQECEPVNRATTSLDAGWYVVNDESITIDGTLALEGDVNLILVDDATLTVTGGIAGEGFMILKTKPAGK